MKTHIFVILWILGGVSFIMALILFGLGLINAHNKALYFRESTTKYQAYYDGAHINCNMMSMTKNCANLSDCDDKNSYFCVQNVKMFVDKK